jgi:hypothetical protein
LQAPKWTPNYEKYDEASQPQFIPIQLLYLAPQQPRYQYPF